MVKKIIFIIINMLIIFSPNFKIFPKWTWIVAGMGIVLLFNEKFREQIGVKRKSNVIIISLLFIAILISILIPIIYRTYDFSYFPLLVGMMLAMLRGLVIVYIFICFFKEKANVNEYIKMFIDSAILYVVFTLLLILIPGFKEFWYESIIYPIPVEFPEYYPYRIGIDGFAGFASAIIFSIATLFTAYRIMISKTSKEFTFYFLRFIFIIIGDLLYGRITLVAVGLSVLMIIFFTKNKKNVVMFLSTTIALIITTIPILFKVAQNNPVLQHWVNWAFEIFINFFKTGSFTSYSSSHLLNDMIFIPNVKTLIFGDGLFTVAGRYYMSTDVGYLRTILFFGIIGAIFNYGVLILIIKKIRDNFNNIKNSEAKILVVFLTINFLILEIKGQSFHIFSYCLIPIYFISFFDYKNLFLSKNKNKTLDNELVSIILPVYNAEKYLDECLNSIINQTYRNIEIIAIDDCSSDKSLEILKNYALYDNRLKVFSNNENKKLIYTLNKGLELASGYYIARMDSDDICDRQRIEKQVLLMNKNKKIVMTGTSIRMFGEKKSKWITETNNEKLKIKLLFGTEFAHPTVMFRGKTLKEHNIKYNYDYRDAEDFKMWVDIAKYGEVSNIKQKLLSYRIVNTSISNQNSNSQKNTTFKIIKENLLELGIKIDNEEIIEYLNCGNYKHNKIRYSDIKNIIDDIIKSNNKNYYDEKKLNEILNEKLFIAYVNEKGFNIKNIYKYIRFESLNLINTSYMAILFILKKLN